MTSPLLVPAGLPIVSVDPPAPLLPVAVARSEIPPGCDVGLVGVDLGLVGLVGVDLGAGPEMVKESVKLLGAVEPIKLAATVS